MCVDHNFHILTSSVTFYSEVPIGIDDQTMFKEPYVCWRSSRLSTGAESFHLPRLV